MKEKPLVAKSTKQWLDLRAHLYRIRLPEETEEADNCAICLANGRLTTMPCGHQRHTNCFAEFESHNWDGRCPICRQNVDHAAHSAAEGCRVVKWEAAWTTHLIPRIPLVLTAV
jgi:hypothetical protein